MNLEIQNEFRSNWFIKFIECLFAAVAITNTLAIFFEVLPTSILIKFGENFFNWLLIVQVVLAILFAIIYSIYWHKKSIKNTINSGVRHAWFRAILRYWLAFDIATYGFAKILKTQFAHSFHRDDSLVSSLNGFNLTWNYFAHSYALAVIIGLLQIFGSILLLFRKTTLLGVSILLPILVNILLINIFYDIASGAFLNSVLFTLGLLYLLLLRWVDLKEVFLNQTSKLPAIGYSWFKYITKFLSIALAFGMIYYLVESRHANTQLIGKWNVDKLIKNKGTLSKDAWLMDSTAWKKIYIEEGSDLICSPNPYVCDTKKGLWLEYKYDSTLKNIQVVYWKKNNPIDTTIFKVSSYDGKHMQWNTIFHKDTLQLWLSKEETKN
jgi:hypothetical protein